MRRRLVDLGHAGVASGWRKRLADRAAPPLARRTPLASHHVRAAIGLLFVGLAAGYLLRTLRRAAAS